MPILGRRFDARLLVAREPVVERPLQHLPLAILRRHQACTAVLARPNPRQHLGATHARSLSYVASSPRRDTARSPRLPPPVCTPPFPSPPTSSPFNFKNSRKTMLGSVLTYTLHGREELVSALPAREAAARVGGGERWGRVLATQAVKQPAREDLLEVRAR